METKDELKLKITAAYDSYLDKIEALGNEYAIVPPSPRQVQDDPRTHAAAAQLWAEFNAEQDRLNAEYFAPRDAKALAARRQKRPALLMQSARRRQRQTCGKRRP